MKFILAFLLLVSFKTYAQYPFEKYPAIKYDSVSFKIVDLNDSTQMGIARYKDYTIKLIEGMHDGGEILLYYKNKLINKAIGYFVRVGAVDFPLYIEDINDDGRPDFIVEAYSEAAAGLASGIVYNTFLINNGGNNFQTLGFKSFYNKSHKAYEFNNDGNHLIIGQSLAYYKGHDYWLFDLYNYKNDKLINVSKKYNYPIAVPYLKKETFKVTKKIPKKDLEKLSLKFPDTNTSL